MRAILLAFLASTALAQSRPLTTSAVGGVSLNTQQTITGAKTFSATLTAGLLTSTVASGSDAVRILAGARLRFGSDGTATRAYLYQCQANQDEICAAQSFRIGGAINAGALTVATGAQLAFEGVAKIAAPITDDTATPGNRTIHKLCGKNAIAAAGTAAVITNSLVLDANAVFSVAFLDTDATCTVLKYAPAAGSVTFTCNAAATAATKFSWCLSANKID